MHDISYIENPNQFHTKRFIHIYAVMSTRSGAITVPVLAGFLSPVARKLNVCILGANRGLV